MIMKSPLPRHWLGGVVATTMLVAPHVASAQQPAIGSGDWYYQLGGATPISPAPNVNSIAIPLGGSVGLQVPRACGSLDPAIAITNTLDDVANAADQLDGLLVAAATNAIAALPAIILQRANPGLYEHFQNALAAAQRTYDLSVASCQELVETNEQGDNPFGVWIKASKRDTWTRRLGDEDADSVDAETEVNTVNGDLGVLWLNGDPKGGVDQDPLPVVRDTVQAGYNLILGRDVEATGAPDVADARLVELFATTEEAGDFAIAVLGDVVIQTCQGCTPSTVAATGGLLRVYEAEREIVDEGLRTLIAGQGLPEQDELDEISAATVIITAKLIEDFREIEEDQDRALLAARLAADVAVARTAEQALALRRMLLTGRQVPEIVNHAQATELLDKKLAHLEEITESLLFEPEIQSKLVSNTASIVTATAEGSRTTSVGDLNVDKTDPQDLILQGRVRPQQ